MDIDIGQLSVFFAGVFVALAIVFLSKSSPSGNAGSKASEVEEASPTREEATTTPARKKKSKGKKGKGNKSSDSDARSPIREPASTTTPVQQEETPTPAPALEAVPVASSSSGKKKETAEQRAERLERQRLRKEAKEAKDRADEEALRRAVLEAEAAVAEAEADQKDAERRKVQQAAAAAATQQEADGWTMVKPSKGKQKKAAAAAEAQKMKQNPAEAAVASGDADAEKAVVAPEVFTAEVVVDARKVGVVIGPKGATMNAIEAATGAKITLPSNRDRSDDSPVTAIISGPRDSLGPAKKAVEELSTKGYARILAGDDFMESHVVITARTRSELFLESGKALKAIQSKCMVKINFPPQPPKPTGPQPARDQNVTTKITVAGNKSGVLEAKATLKELSLYHHSELTHPGFVHNEVEVAQHLYNVVIGRGGSEIKHIQGNFAVKVYVPESGPVLVVGPASGVEGAVRYIEKIVDAAVQAAQVAAEAVDNSAWEQQEEPTEPQPEWMDQYDYAKQREAMAQADATNAPADAPEAAVSTAAPTPQEAMAWGVVGGGDAEGWGTL